MTNPFDTWTEKQQTRGAFARNEEGWPVAPDGPAACQWCALGRLMRFHYNQGNQAYQFYNFLNQHPRNPNRVGVVGLNDFEGWTPEEFKQAWDECFQEKPK